MNQPFSNILVPHDGTEISDKALDEGIKFATLFDSKLTILYVIEEQIIPPNMILSFIKKKAEIHEAKKNIVEIIKSGAESMLRNRVQTAKDKNIDVDAEIRIGSPSKEILNYATEKNIDIIIMGSRQKGGIEKIKALGSVARKISEMSECPVLLVH